MSRQVQDQARALYPTMTANGPDHKAWAKRILYRGQHGDKDLTSLQVAFAREAIEGKEAKK